MPSAVELSAVLLLLLAGGWLGWRARGTSRTEAMAAFALPVCAGLLLYAYCGTARLGTCWTWSACRLAPTIAWTRGYPLYSPADAGPINGWLYGPVAAIAWLPAALAGSPLPALWIAMVINLGFLLAPVFLVVRVLGPDDTRGAWLAPMLGAALLLQIYATWYMASSLNADAIATGLGAGSCLALLTRRADGARRLALAAILASLAAWTKQTEVPLIVAQCLWLWWKAERGVWLRYLLIFAASLAALGAAFLVLFDPRAMWFNLWQIPSVQPLPGGWAAAWRESADFVRYTWIFWLPAGVALVARTKTASGGAASPESGVDPVPLLWSAAVVLLPAGIAAAIKVGGDRNSIHSVYYLLIAAVAAIARLDWLAAWPRIRRVAPGLVALATIAAVSLAARQVRSYAGRSYLPQRCLSQEAWRFARTQAGRVYFPWDPLASVMAGEPMGHFEYGVIDRILAGRTPTPERIASGLPSAIRLVVYPRADYPQEMVRRYLPQFRLRSETSDWIIFRRDSAGP